MPLQRLEEEVQSDGDPDGDRRHGGRPSDQPQREVGDRRDGNQGLNSVRFSFSSSPDTVQRSADVGAPGSVNAAVKLRQKW